MYVYTCALSSLLMTPASSSAIVKNTGVKTRILGPWPLALSQGWTVDIAWKIRGACMLYDA